jgi:Flp pilus assembly pilin Flp
MLAATCIAIFIIPALYVLVESLSERWSRKKQASAVPELQPVEGD